MANKEFGNWNPMEDAYKNPAFNSYVEGPGAKLDAGGGRNMRQNEKLEFKLHFSNVPINMTEAGLTNIIEEFAIPKLVYISHVPENCPRLTTWSIVEFGTFGDAEVTMRGCNEKPPYHFIVKFAKSRDERARGGAGDRNGHNRGDAQPDREYNDRPFRLPNRGNQQQLQPLSVAAQVSSARRKEALRTAIECHRTNNSDFGNACGMEDIQSSPIWGEFYDVNLYRMKTSERYSYGKSGSGWKMGVSRRYYSQSPSNATNKFQASAVNNSPHQAKNLNSSFEKKTNSSPQGSKHLNGSFQELQNLSSHDGAPSTPKATSGPCGLCEKITSGSCGACGLVWYCSQSCARKHFTIHVPHCRIPVPAINFHGEEDAVVDVSPMASKNIESPTAKGIDSRNVNRGGHVEEASNDCTTPSRAVAGYKNEEQNRNDRFGHQRSRENFSNNFNRPGHNNHTQRRSFGGKAADKEEDLSTPTSNINKSLSPPTKQELDDKKSPTNGQKKVWFEYEKLDSKSEWEVKVMDVNPRYVVVMKVENVSELQKINEKLDANAAKFPPYDPQESIICAGLFQGSWYRATPVTKAPDKYKYIDYGNMMVIKPEHVRSLPQEYTTLPAQGIKVMFQDSPPHMLNLGINSIIKIKVVEAAGPTNIWNVELVQEGGGSSSSADHSTPSANPPQKSPPSNLSPFPRNNLPKLLANSQHAHQNLPASQAPTLFHTEVPPLDSYTLVTISRMIEGVFWASRKSKNEQLEEMMVKLNTSLSENSSPHSSQPQVGDLIAVYHEDTWFRAKVIKLEPKLRVGLVDYGDVVEPSAKDVKALPTEFLSLPGQAMKFKPYGNCTAFPLNVESQIEVKPKSLEKVNGCYLVEIRYPSSPSDHLVKKKTEMEGPASVKGTSPPTEDALSAPSYPAEKLPMGVSTQVSIVLLEGSVVWVNKMEHLESNTNSMEKVYSYCIGTRDRIQPKVGAIVGADYGGAWFRAQVLNVTQGPKGKPMIRVYYLDYGNTADVTIENVVVLPEEFVTEPAQAIKISFTKNISPQSLALREGSSIFVTPLTEEKCADGSIVVEVQDNPVAQLPQEPPAQVPVDVAPVAAVPVDVPPVAAVPVDVAPVAAVPVTPPSAQVTAVPAVSNGPLLTLQPFDLPEGQYTEVTTLAQQGWVTIVANIELLNAMMVYLHKTLNEMSHPIQPVVGDFVACKFDTFWHRAKVVIVTSTNVRVLYIDYGEEGDIPVGEICLLPPDAYNLPIQAGKITFVDGTPEKYNELQEDQMLQVKPLQKRPDGSLIVALKDVTIVAEKSVTNDVPVQSPLAAVLANPSTIQPGGSQDSSCKVIEHLSAENVNEVIVTATAENELWTNVTAKTNVLDVMMDGLQKEMSSLAPCSYSPQVGDYVSVLYDALNMWHRGKVLSIAANIVEARFIDYGTVEKIPLDKVKILPAEFTKLPSQGIKIQLCAGTPSKYQHPNLDDILHVQLITELIDGTAIVAVVNK